MHSCLSISFFIYLFFICVLNINIRREFILFFLFFISAHNKLGGRKDLNLGETRVLVIYMIIFLRFILKKTSIPAQV